VNTPCELYTCTIPKKLSALPVLAKLMTPNPSNAMSPTQYAGMMRNSRWRKKRYVEGCGRSAS
jgi:hypothetical protein